MPSQDRFLVRLLWLTLAAALLILAWRGAPLLFGHLGQTPDVAPRVVTPRGDLAADERATIQLFEQTRASVVFTPAVVVQPLTCSSQRMW